MLPRECPERDPENGQDIILAAKFEAKHTWPVALSEMLVMKEAFAGGMLQ